jgi:hypothetical protein
MRKKAFAITFLFASIVSSLYSGLGIPSVEDLKTMNIVVDLKEPSFENGEMKTDQGGIIEADGIRLQARKIRYIKKKEGEVQISRVEAEGDLLFEYHGRVFVGDRISYDFISHTGEIINPRASIDSWFIGGERIVIHSDRSFTVYNTYITTCEHEHTGWQIQADEATVKNDNIARIKNVRFQFIKIPLLWIPRMSADLSESFDIPISYRISGGASAGLWLSMRYKLFATDATNVYAKFDIRTRKGVGGGIETEYEPDGSDTHLYTRNYIARDGSLLQRDQNTRYQLAGKFYTTIKDERYTFDGKWDKLSDKDMTSDYRDHGLRLDTAEKTEFNIRRRDEDSITWVSAKARVNSFQTVKQELPMLNGTIRPVNIANTGIINESSASLGLLDYQYAKELEGLNDFHSVRSEIKTEFYRPFHPTEGVNILPEVGGNLICYENSPFNRAETLFAGFVGGRAEADFFRTDRGKKKVITPYIAYRFRTSPTSNPNQHYIFDIDDGYARLHQATLGIEHQIFTKYDTRLFRSLTANLWTHYFIDTPVLEKAIPKTYGSIVWNPTESVTTTFESAWDHIHDEIGYFNARCSMTVTEDLAFSAEGRYRNKYEWRKSDRDNFMMESFFDQSTLVNTILSDRRTTVLLHGFYRLNPTFAFESEFRHGTARKGEPAYNEYECSLLGYLDCGWDMRLSYSQREYDHAFSFSIKLRPGAHEDSCEQIQNWLR